jgi:hypothetical protein
VGRLPPARAHHHPAVQVGVSAGQPVGPSNRSSASKARSKPRVHTQQRPWLSWFVGVRTCPDSQTPHCSTNSSQR